MVICFAISLKLRPVYPGQPQLYKDLSFRINGKERFLVVGENGVGKSTLLKLIMGILIPEQGRVRYNPKTDVAYLHFLLYVV